MRILLVLTAVVACGGPTDPGAARVFRDNFDPPDTAWALSGQGAKAEGGKLLLSTGVGPTPSATYTLPSPFGPGWDFKVSVGTGAGAPCPTVRISSGDTNRHGWFLHSDPGQGYWGLQVGSGGDWEWVGSEFGAAMGNPTEARLLVNGDRVGVWFDGVQVVDTVVSDAPPNAVDIELGVSRCNIVAGRSEYDWVEIRELERS